MNKEQQIKEMADEIFNAGVGLDGSDFAYKSDHFDRLAIKLYKAGYRKRSEMVKEFAEEISEVMDEHAEQNGYDAEGLPIYVCDISVLQIEIEKLAEQYSKEE